MKYSKIIEILGNSRDIKVLSRAADSDITHVRLWSGGDQPRDDSTLYFSYDAQSPCLPPSCILAADHSGSSATALSGNVAVLAAADFVSAFNEAQDIISNQSSSGFYNYMMEVANSVRSVDALIDIASQSFNASLIFIDRNFRILSYSTQIPVTDALWVENIKKGFCDYEFISEVRKLKSLQMADSSSTPVEVTCKSSPYRKLASRVYCRDTLVGSLILIEGDDTYRTDHAEMLRVLSGVTGYSVLSYSPELLYRTSEYHSFLYNLIIGAPPDTLPEAYRDLKFQDDMRVLYFRSDDDAAPLPKESVLRKDFEKILPDCHVISHRKAAIVICGDENVSTVKRLIDIFETSGTVRAGISNTFHHIEQLHDALKESQDALYTGKLLDPEYQVYFFSDYSLYVLLRHLSGSEDIGRYLNPAITLLANYDSVNGTMLLETLRVYLSSNCSIKDTSEALYLHRNSIIYRLKKIKELCGIDPEDHAARLSLEMSFAILQIKP